MNNWRTTVVGIVFGALTILSQVEGLSGKPLREWTPYVIQALALAVLGYVSKDAKPKEDLKWKK
jgi:hypothetical protein